FLVYALIPIIPTFFISKSLKDRVRPGYNAVRKAMKRVFQEVDEALLGFGVIKDFAIEAKFFKKIERAATFLDSESRRTSYLAASMVPATKILVQIGVLAILVHATILMRNGALSFGQFATVSFLSRKFLLPFSFLGGLTDMCGKGVNAYNNVTSAIRLPRDFQFRSAIEVYPAIETIRIDALTFSYDQRPIFANLNVEFKPGRLNVIKGVTGAGKSTLFRLILGDLKPSAGHVYIGSTEADVYSQSSRQNIALVTQFPKLFTASLRENITLFATEVDDERLRRALSVSLIETLVQELPDGLDTVIGPSGLQLSGGQMQSVAIARAIYSRANVLLLDEPTASFDVQREKDFLLRLKQNLGNRILIVTSHRAQPIEFADSVLTL
ncbi:MAG: ABC transporter ATP-binding protein, partial [Pseudomonadota bacterium]